MAGMLCLWFLVCLRAVMVRRYEKTGRQAGTSNKFQEGVMSKPKKNQRKIDQQIDAGTCNDGDHCGLVPECDTDIRCRIREAEYT